MPFDYNSFLKGVQTGLRLGRTAPGRQPPMPPVPSGRYILTESGEKVLTEKPVYDASVYSSGVWYGAYRYRVNSYITAYGEIPCQFFFANITSGLSPSDLGVHLMGFHFNYEHSLLYGYVYVDFGNEEEHEVIATQRFQFASGMSGTYEIGRTSGPISSTFPMPSGTRIFEGSLDETINFGWNTQYADPVPMLTE